MSCQRCGNASDSDICDSCALEVEREEAAAFEAEYEDARWDLAKQYGYEHP